MGKITVKGLGNLSGVLDKFDAEVNDVVRAAIEQGFRYLSLTHQVMNMIDMLKVGDTLRINRQLFLQHGGSLEDVAAPAYCHKRWIDDVTGELCIQRLE